ncbi:universal stress protein [Burkholderia glumae]|uniref:universal stress protein n=1 Tax=Burkholderia glumae TaxID=337 RepID=UPI0021518B66|nr:universal stress protein [Burkholderia glumae]UVS99470.1 universal stress protein [Burkholderia glumae]
MKYKTVLVHLDDSAPCEVRLACTVELAQRHDAHLSGLYLPPPGKPLPLFESYEAQEAADAERRLNHRRQHAREVFDNALARAGCRGEWLAPLTRPVDAAVLHARHADLVVLGQHDPNAPETEPARHFCTDLLMRCGRPVLILPHAGRPGPCGENVLVAWDQSREAARAVSDALPLLKRARFVTVETVHRARHVWPAEMPADNVSIAGFLERHGIRAAFATTRADPGWGTGGTLLNRISDLHADLLVMGAYGHARVTELLLGGVTRSLLQTMTVPVLMSH